MSGRQAFNRVTGTIIDHIQLAYPRYAQGGEIFMKHLLIVIFQPFAKVHTILSKTAQDAQEKVLK